MLLRQSSRLLRTALKSRPTRFALSPTLPSVLLAGRQFQTSSHLQRIQTHILSDIGEGVKEVQIIQWFVEEGAAVEEWAPLCEVQSDKASVEITSKYTGVIKKLRFERDAIAQVGDSLLDIEVEGEEEEPAEEQQESREEPAQESEERQQEEPQAAVEEPSRSQEGEDDTAVGSKQIPAQSQPAPPKRESKPKEPGTAAGLATPAVRGLLKEHGLDITDIEGSGKDGRVLKEDIFKYLEEGKQSSTQSADAAVSKPQADSKQVETTQNLTPIQSAMFKSMTKSLQIPHFLYSDRVDITALAAMRSRLNATRDTETTPKFSYLPFVIKAVSLALNKYPLLNARIDASDSAKPKLLMRSNHNIGVAMDTPAGLLVPVIKSVNARSIVSITQELQRLSQLGQAGKLTNNDLSGGTITISNVGNIGGEVLAPVIVEGQLAIMGIGKIKPTPVFAEDGLTVKRADLMNTSWSADHRVIDGATMARMAKVVQSYLGDPETMMMDMT